MSLYPSKFFYSATLAAFLLSLVPSLAFAQQLEVTDGTNATEIKIQNLLKLTPLNAVDPPPPAHEFLYIFSDGSFINKTRDSIVQHVYNLKGAANADVATHTVVTSIYSGGAPPPERIGDTTNVTSKTTPSQLTQAVPPGAFINLQRNHTRLVPNHGTTYILSVKNTISQDSTFPLSGDLLLFYDGRIDRVIAHKTDTTFLPKTDAAGDTLFVASTPMESFNFFDGMGVNVGPFNPNSYGVEEASFKPHYKKVMRWRFDRLFPEEERHLFITMQSDKDLLVKAPEEEKGVTRLLAMALLDSITQRILTPLLTQEEQAWLQEAGILEGLSDGLLASIQGDGFTIGSQDSRLIDIHENMASISKGHDPNRLTIEACECPAESEVGQKLLVTVEYENDGSGDVDKVFITMDLPEGLSPDRIPDTLVSSHPAINPADITVARTGNSITWTLSNMLIRPVMDFGAGHPATFGSISFYAFLEKGLPLDSLSSQQACVRFGAETEPPVCTPPAILSLLSPGSETYGQGELDCTVCEASRLRGENGQGFPWWLGLLILLILILLFFIAWLFRRRTGETG